MVLRKDGRRISLVREQELTTQEKENLSTYVKKLPVPRKLEYAARGNKEVRGILAKDPNKIVARAVITNPHVSEDEVYEFSRSTNVNEEVLRYIAENAGMLKKHRVAVALCNNPRSPVGAAMRLLPRLDIRELKLLAKNREIPSTIRMQARRIVTVKVK